MTRADLGVTVIIPARYGSSRFPGKPLAVIAGKTLIQRVYESVQSAPGIHTVLVATDDQRIFDAVRRFGGASIMMSGEFRTGTDRVAAVAEQLPGDAFVNLQGDEILLDPRLLTDLVTPFLLSDAGMGTLKRRLISWQDVQNPGVVKVVTDARGQALYFSRAPIPHVRESTTNGTPSDLYAIHLGLYIFRRETLRRVAALPTGRLEEAEKLEQLRALENGIGIMVWETQHPSLRIDTPDDAVQAASQLASAAQVYSQAKGGP